MPYPEKGRRTKNAVALAFWCKRTARLGSTRGVRKNMAFASALNENANPAHPLHDTDFGNADFHPRCVEFFKQ